MRYEECLHKIAESLGKVGIILEDDYEKKDYNLQDYFQESVQYITAIVQLEEDLDITIPDELLIYESIFSFHAFAKAIYELLMAK